MANRTPSPRWASANCLVVQLVVSLVMKRVSIANSRIDAMPNVVKIPCWVADDRVA